MCMAHGVSNVGEPVRGPARQKKASHPSERLLEQSAASWPYSTNWGALGPRFNSNVPGAYLQLFSYLKYISIDEEIGLYSVYQVLYYFVHL